MLFTYFLLVLFKVELTIGLMWALDEMTSLKYVARPDTEEVLSENLKWLILLASHRLKTSSPVAKVGLR